MESLHTSSGLLFSYRASQGTLWKLPSHEPCEKVGLRSTLRVILGGSPRDSLVTMLAASAVPAHGLNKDFPEML